MDSRYISVGCDEAIVHARFFVCVVDPKEKKNAHVRMSV